jgi:nitrate reductase gamma subunit
MHTIYSFVYGPLAWAAFLLFVGGCLFRLVQMLRLINKTEKFIWTYMSWKYSLRSLLHWLTPFAATNWRKQPLLTVVTFVFHICLLVTPIFLLSHIVLWDESWNLRWWALPDGLADIMTVLVIIGGVYFLIRRLTRPEVQFVTDWTDYMLLAMVTAPFITGFIAYHQWFGVQWMTILHMVSGEILLAAMPFTRLVHMLFAPFTRAYMGSEFGKVRHARDW